MNRGSAVSTNSNRSRPARNRFNEAPIHESGKSAWTMRGVPQGLPRFNEAPIHESGK